VRLAFLGTPEAAVDSLRALCDAGHDVAVVITQPDRRRGRGAATMPSPVKAAALELGLSVADSIAAIEPANVDAGVVVAYGRIVPGRLLEVVPMVNVHFSLLPRWRGAAPVERAILAGDEVTGVCVMGLEATLDTGPVFASAETPVDAKYADELTSELAATGARLLVEVLGERPWPTPHEQVGEATYAEKLTADDRALDPDEPALALARRVRIGRAHCAVAGRRVIVERAHHGDDELAPGSIAVDGESVRFGTAAGCLVVEQVRPEGSGSMPVAAWWAGARLGRDAQWGRSAGSRP
jgi:methionyl-tRNA formyltransferase